MARHVLGWPIGLDDFNEMRYAVRCPLCGGTHIHALRADELTEGMRSADCPQHGSSYLVRRPTLNQLQRMRATLIGAKRRTKGTKAGRRLIVVESEIERLTRKVES